MIIITEILLIFFLVILNGTLALSEMAIVTSRQARLQERADKGDKGAGVALELARQPDRFLSTVQIGITLVGILAGALGGATIAHEIGEALAAIPLLAHYSEAIGIGTVVVCTTYLSLVLGELAPKRLALNNPEKAASLIARPMKLLSQIADPVVRLLSFSTGFVVGLFGMGKSNESAITEEEFKIMLREGKKAGVLKHLESQIAERALLIDDVQIGALMTPRTEMVQLHLYDPIEESYHKMIASPYSEFPAFEHATDSLPRILSIKDLWRQSIKGEETALRDCLRQPLFVPENAPAYRVLEMLKQSGETIALVINEFGGFEGAVRLVDILEALVGDILLPGQMPEPTAIQREDGSWLVDGLLPIEEIKEYLHLQSLPDEALSGYRTVGGLVMMGLGEIPTEADSFEWEGLHFEVIDMDGYRVDKVLITQIERPAESDEPSTGDEET